MDTRKRCIWIVLDSVGIGAAPDAERYGAADEQSNTIAHVADALGGLNVPNLAQLGLGNITPIDGVPKSLKPGAYGRMREVSYGKDTTNGHWEFVGVILENPLPTYPDGFPREVIKPFEDYTGKRVLCNEPASGTVVIEEYGPLHEDTGRPIVYTSADSVFQVAAHESVVPVDTLYDWCRYARSILVGEHGVGRVIARPFTGSKGAYQRTHRRKDFSLTFGDTVLNTLQRHELPVCGIGKISDIYGGSGITTAIHTESNQDGMNQLVERMQVQDSGLIYANLVDFDALYGHRNNPEGFGRAIEEFDVQLTKVLDLLRDDDLLCITADHGCDPTVPGTDHTREWVPLLLFNKTMTRSVSLGDRETFADIGATIAEYFSLPSSAASTGTSVLSKLW
ncbi:phosphopentomutase [Alicyclobacillus sp. SO9]|uniref:phosphopentomutase n=1 Tax=Alicyclobacillus sp. SO9 TaxID=2665646 RepID=UPI0018E81A26|nr:phosphopentomutase [Alicyclobacillus sp. SO9]QQE76916.1 phosphopentomutase [Alicyclobacillus sp. SO9]